MIYYTILRKIKNPNFIYDLIVNLEVSMFYCGI